MTGIELTALTLAMLLTLTGQASSPPPVQAVTLTDAQRGHLRAEQFAAVLAVGNLPKEVRDGLRDLFRSPTLELAEPGAEWQVTDVIMKPNLPVRRLILAGCASDHCLIHYERGGIAHIHYVVLFQLSKGTAQFEWGGLVPPPGLQDLDALKDAIISGKVKGGSSYW